MKHTFLFVSITCCILSACSQKLTEVKNIAPLDTQQQWSWSTSMTGNTFMTSWNTLMTWGTVSMAVKTRDEASTWNIVQTTSSEKHTQVLDSWKWTTAGYESEFWTIFLNHEVWVNKVKVKITLKWINKMAIAQFEKTCYTEILNSKITELIQASKNIQVKNIENWEAEVSIDWQILTDVLRTKWYLVRDDWKAVRELSVCLPDDWQ